MRNNRESLQKQVDDLKEKVTNQQRTIANLEDKLGKYEPVERTGQHPGPRGPMDRGPGPMDRGPGPMDRGPGPMDRGPGPMDHGSGYGGRPDRPSSGGQRMGGGGESPRNYRPPPDERERGTRESRTSFHPYGGGRGDHGGGGGYQRRPNEPPPQRFQEREWRPHDDRSRPRPDEYQVGNVRAATHNDHTQYGRGGGAMGGAGGRMDDRRQFNPGGRDFPPPQQPQPYVDFTPLQKPSNEGGAGGRRGSDLNDLNQPRGQSGGGELFM